MKHSTVAVFEKILLQLNTTVALGSAQINQMVAHWEMLCQWNRRVNLTSITSDEDAAHLHYADSLASVPYLQGGPIVDIGSGAGFPGIPLAVALPQWDFLLLEPRRKRTSFLRTVVARLRLPNVKVLEGRLQDLCPQLHCHAVTRATFSQARQFLEVARWLKPSGSLIAYRAAGVTNSAAEAHVYEVCGTLKKLECWSFHALNALPVLEAGTE